MHEYLLSRTSIGISNCLIAAASLGDARLRKNSLAAKTESNGEKVLEALLQQAAIIDSMEQLIPESKLGKGESMKKTTLVGLAVCMLLLAMASTSNAQVINGCVGRIGGLLRIVSSASQCTPLETHISWNAAGPQGPQGPQGPPGVTNGISAAVYGTVAFIGGGPGAISPQPATFSVDHEGPGEYKITFTPNPFIPTSVGDNAPMCIAVGGQNPRSSVCSGVPGYDGTQTPPFSWMLFVFCSDLTGSEEMDADFQFICIQK